MGEGKVLGKVDSIQLLVEDHMMETQIMRRSPYVKPFEKDAKYNNFHWQLWCKFIQINLTREWEQQLNDLQVLLEQCVFIQERWCSLEPLLTSPDVLSIAPEEARKFSAIDKVNSFNFNSNSNLLIRIIMGRIGGMCSDWLANANKFFRFSTPSGWTSVSSSASSRYRFIFNSF